MPRLPEAIVFSQVKVVPARLRQSFVMVVLPFLACFTMRLASLRPSLRGPAISGGLRTSAGGAGDRRMRQHLWAGLQVLCFGTLLAVGARAEDKIPASNQPAAAAEDTCKRASFKVLIDVGHTPEDPGAISAHGNPE